MSNSLDPIRPDELSDLISVQTVCNGYQQATLAGEELIYVHISSHSNIAKIVSAVAHLKSA